jgi:ATP-dependent DNA ligase
VTLPLSERRKALETLLPGRPNPLRLSPLLEAPAGQVLATVRKLGLGRNRGQRIDSLYESGERSGARVNQASREYGARAVIGDYIPGARGFDALLVGVYEKKDLRCEGEERLCASNSGGALPGAQGAANFPVPLHQSA